MNRHSCHELSLDGGQTGVLADRLGPGTTQLDAVVFRRIVAGREHRTRAIEQAGGEVELIGGREPDVYDIEALRGHSVGESTREVGRGRSHVVANHDL